MPKARGSGTRQATSAKPFRLETAPASSSRLCLPAFDALAASKAPPIEYIIGLTLVARDIDDGPDRRPSDLLKNRGRDGENAGPIRRREQRCCGGTRRYPGMALRHEVFQLVWRQAEIGLRPEIID